MIVKPAEVLVGNVTELTFITSDAVVAIAEWAEWVVDSEDTNDS